MPALSSAPVKETVEPAVQRIGRDLLQAIRGARVSLFSSQGAQGRMMAWSMKHEAFKVALFRFVDVLPALRKSRDVVRRLCEYLEDPAAHTPAWMRPALWAARLCPPLAAPVIRASIGGMARQFIAGKDETDLLQTLRKLHAEGIAFTVDLLGEAVVSEPEASAVKERYLRLLDILSAELGTWNGPTASNRTATGQVPALNISIKITALFPLMAPTVPEENAQELIRRLRPLLQKAKRLGAAVTIDMESYALKNQTFMLVHALLDTPELADWPWLGLAVQAYLRETQDDLRALLDHCRRSGRRITIRLVKGAYWDYETAIAQQNDWPCPVFSRKQETDASYEACAQLLLENLNVVDAAFATHNVRSIAAILANAQARGIDERAFEFQALYGMAEPIKRALLSRGCRLRDYTPMGELLPGMAYLVRRLLENTSNEGFLRAAFFEKADEARLLADPAG